MRGDNMIELDGKTFTSISEVAESVNITVINFKRRMKVHNESLEETYLYYKEKSLRKKDELIIDGKKFNTKKEVLEYLGVSKWTINNRIREQNISFIEACEFYLEKQKVYSIDDKIFKNISELCDYLKINRNTLYKRMRTHNETLEETINYYKGKMINE